MADARATGSFARLVDIMARLRGADGCPWDREQTPQSLRPFLLEEAYEVLEAIDQGNSAALCEELGDLLLQIVFQSQLAGEADRFTIADVATGIADKLVRRHPHVFGDTRVQNAQEVVRNWSRIKAEERRTRSDADLFSGVPAALPALAHAQQIGARAAHIGLDWPDAAAVATKVCEEQAELAAAIERGDRSGIERELGDVLLALTNLARHLDVSAELALRAADERFIDRARRFEKAAAARGILLDKLSAADRDALWRAIKDPNEPPS
jgi:MazG family protein